MRSIFTICAAVLMAASAPEIAAQQVEQGDLDSVLSEQKAERAREVKLKAEREKIQGEVKGLNKRLGQQIQTLSGLGTDIGTAQSSIEDMDADYKDKKNALLADDKQLSKFLGYLQRLERRTPSPVLTSPRSALKASQSALLIQSLSREFDQRSRALQIRIDELARVKDSLITERAGLEQKQARIRGEETRLKSLLGQRSEKAASIADEEKKARQNAARLAAKAENLKQLLDALAAAVPEISPRVKPRNPGSGRAPQKAFAQTSTARAFTRAKNKLLSPVIGRLKRKFGGAEQGVTLSAKARGAVKAPYNGRVEFAGPFKDYDNVVILNVGEGYFLLLTGLGTIIVDAGDRLASGDIIGALPAPSTGNAEIYIELRKGGTPIDPSPWFSSF